MTTYRRPSKYSEALVAAMRADYAAGMSKPQISARHGVPVGSVWSVVHRVQRPALPAGYGLSIVDLSDAERTELLRAYAAGERAANIQRRFGLRSIAMVRRYAIAQGVPHGRDLHAADDKEPAVADMAVAAPTPPAAPKSALVLRLEESAGRYAALAEIAAEFRLTMTRAQQLWHRVRCGQGVAV